MSSRQNSCRFTEGQKKLLGPTRCVRSIKTCVRPRLLYQQPIALNTRRSTLGEHPTRHSFYMLDCSTFFPSKVHPQVVSPTTLWSSEARKFMRVKPLQELQVFVQQTSPMRERSQRHWLRVSLTIFSVEDLLRRSSTRDVQMAHDDWRCL